MQSEVHFFRGHELHIRALQIDQPGSPTHGKWRPALTIVNQATSEATDYLIEASLCFGSAQLAISIATDIGRAHIGRKGREPLHA